MTRPVKRPAASHTTVAKAAKTAPGTWVRVNEYPTTPYAKSVAAQIQAGHGRFLAYAPPGAYEARVTDLEFGTEVHVRYIAAVTAVPAEAKETVA